MPSVKCQEQSRIKCRIKASGKKKKKKSKKHCGKTKDLNARSDSSVANPELNGPQEHVLLPTSSRSVCYILQPGFGF